MVKRHRHLLTKIITSCNVEQRFFKEKWGGGDFYVKTADNKSIISWPPEMVTANFCSETHGLLNFFFVQEAIPQEITSFL